MLNIRLLLTTALLSAVTAVPAPAPAPAPAAAPVPAPEPILPLPSSLCISLPTPVLPPLGVTCGRVTCPGGQVCCNASCSICTDPDGACIALYCGHEKEALPAADDAGAVAADAAKYKMKRALDPLEVEVV